MAFVSALVVTNTASALSSIRSFLVSTIGWTIIASAVSGVDDGFVVRSSGVSGDRQICIKIGASIAGQSVFSVFACVSFASATSIASNATSDLTIHMNSNANVTIWMEGDLNHFQIGNNLSPSLTQETYLYAGLADEFRKITSAVPNLAFIANANSIHGATARMVEPFTGTFNQTTKIDGLVSAFTNQSDPNLYDGLVYMWPITVADNSTARVFGTLYNAFLVGPSVAQGATLNASSVDYTLMGIVNDRIAMKMG